ncbi:PREDICTED: nuclear body protein SP140-like, partial [Galeopterus variegatus]|uniref:Nuclear body protein SP140-like n=1 Tax=Galeopterus variegatus TaxID=482537 RepID=A0ABM0Q3K3_GALVR
MVVQAQLDKQDRVTESEQNEEVLQVPGGVDQGLTLKGSTACLEICDGGKPQEASSSPPRCEPEGGNAFWETRDEEGPLEASSSPLRCESVSSDLEAPQMTDEEEPEEGPSQPPGDGE